MKQRLIFKRSFLCTMTALMIAFIFINSSLDADTSSRESMGVLEFINNILSSLEIDLILSENFVRKCAHFAEYFVLGTLLYYTVGSFTEIQVKKLVASLAVGLLTACVDETIQLFSLGRSGQFSDVLLDFFGVCTAVLLFYCITKWVSKIKDKEVLN